MAETTVILDQTLLDQVDSLAQQLKIPRDELIARALQAFVAHESTGDIAAPGSEQRIINQGDIFWVQLADPSGVEPGIPHPHVVIQDDAINHSRVDTVVVCALTSALKRASLPGNVVLDPGEANLPKPSVVEVSKASAIDKTRLGAYIGTLSAQRVQQILAGMRFLHASFFARYNDNGWKNQE